MSKIKQQNSLFAKMFHSQAEKLDDSKPVTDIDDVLTGQESELLKDTLQKFTANKEMSLNNADINSLKDIQKKLMNEFLHKKNT